MKKKIYYLWLDLYIYEHVCELDERINDRAGKFAAGELYEIANHAGKELSE